MEQHSATLSITQQGITKPSRLTLTHPDARRRAFKIQHRRNVRYKDRLRWHVGISSSSIVMLDIDGGSKKDALLPRVKEVAHALAKRLGCFVNIYDSGNGYWLIALKKLSQPEWRSAYYWAVSEGDPIDQIHAEASLKWNRTTLRVSDKGDSQEIRKITTVLPS